MTWPISDLMSNERDVKNSREINLWELNFFKRKKKDRICCLALAFSAPFAPLSSALILFDMRDHSSRAGSSAAPWWVCSVLAWTLPHCC